MSGCSGGAGGNVATVNGETISREDFQKYLEVKPVVRVKGSGGQVGEAEVAGSLGLQALADMVNQKLILQLAKDDGVYPTDADIQKEIDYRTKRDPNFLKTLTSQGFTTERIKKQLMIDLAREKVITKGISISDKELNDYIKNNPDRFRKPAMAELLWVVVPTEDLKKKVDQELVAGTQFQAVAIRYSIADSARTMQGTYPSRVEDSFDPRLKAMVEKTPELKATDWLRINEGWAKWYVQKKTASEDIKVDDMVREQVRRAMALERGVKANDLDKRLSEKLRQSKIDVDDPSYKQPFEREMQNFKEAQLRSKVDNGGGASK